MRRKAKLFKRFTTVLLTAAITVTAIPFSADSAKAAVSAPTYKLTVDMTDEQGDILHGAAGFLYGISSEDVPTTNTLVPLRPKVLATKGALGTEHPYGDALDVAKTFLESGGEQVMMYNSNYYGVFGVMANYKDYSKVLKEVIAPHVYQWKQEWKKEHGTPQNPKDNIGAKVDIDKAIIYIPINEGTPNVGAPHFGVAWKAYYDAIHAGDPDATIAGTNDWAYNSAFGTYTDENGNTQNYNLDNFIPYCIENNCMPDIFTWHELDLGTLVTMAEHKVDFENKWKKAWTNAGKKVPELPQICINEYAQSIDCGVPGRLVSWISSLEGIGAYGCLPFWHQANNLNDLTTDPNEPNGAWWTFKWYGDMTGKRVKVTADSEYDKLAGLSTIDNTKQNAKVLFGGQDGNISVVLKNVTSADTFKGADKVHIKVESTTNVGLTGTETNPPVIIDGVYPVNDDGSVSLTITDAKFATSYYVTMTKASEDEEVESPVVYKYQKSYEAEKAALAGGSVKTNGGTGNAGFWGPDSYLSDNNAVIMKKGGELTYTVNVPVDGLYELNFIYGNGTGTKRSDPDNSLSLNLRQSMSVDGGEESIMTMRNTLLTNTTGSNKQYVNLKAGEHKIKIKLQDSGEVLQDFLIVTYYGAYNQEKPLMDSVYEAEAADYNALLDNKASSVKTKNTYSDYSGSGYVEGLTKSVTEGGGIRWNVVVKESGLYNLSIRYRAQTSGNAGIYVGNTVTTLDKKVLSLPVKDTSGKWDTVTGTAYLQKGINIVDADASADISLDYLRVKELKKTAEVTGYQTVIEAEDTIPSDAEKLITVSESKGASGGKYVAKIEGDKNAKNMKGRYLEFTYDASCDGKYEMQVFQSNDEICGTHGYNTKVIDKYMSFEVKDESGNILSDDRYFFMNTNSQDSFKEKTIQLNLKKGKNKIRVYNDDSWEVYFGGSQTEPGENRLVNTMPNIDKFIITPTSVTETIVQDAEYSVNVYTTEGGYAYADKNTVVSGGSVNVNIKPDAGIKKVYVNGQDYTPSVRNNTFVISDVKEDIDVTVIFTDIQSEYKDAYIKNAGFGTKNTLYWDAKDVTVNTNAANSYEGYHAALKPGSTLSQTVKDIADGTYYISVYSQGSAACAGNAVLKVNISGKEYTCKLKAEEEYKCNSIKADIKKTDTVQVAVDTSGLTAGNVYVDNFSIVKAVKRDMSKVSDSAIYFVDAGDYYPDTLPDGEKFGIRSSSTEQIYSQDPVTGYYWGVLPEEDNPQIPRPIFSSGSAVYTRYVFPNRWNMTDKTDKNESYRQTYEQDALKTKFIRYAFELDPGEYVITIGFQGLWGDKGARKIIGNGKQLGEQYEIPSSSEYGMAVRTFSIAEDENELKLSIERNTGNIWVNYIVIEKKGKEADVTALKNLYNEMKLVENDKKDPYTKNTWDAFIEKLEMAQSYLDAEYISESRQEAIDDAAAKIQAAYDGLVKQKDVILNPYKKIEAEDYSEINGANTENCGDDGGTLNVCWTAAGHWLKYSNLDFSDGAQKFIARIASNSAEAEPAPELELRLDSLDGEVIGTMKAEKNGEWQKYITVETDISDVNGMHDVYMIFKGPFNFNWFMFIGNDINPYQRYEAEEYTEKNGANTENCGDDGGTLNVCWTAAGNWLKYSNVGFTKGAKKFIARIASNSGEAEPAPGLELRLDSLDGEVIGTMKAEKNGEWQKYITVETDVKNVTGTHDVYMIFKGPFNFNWWMFEALENEPDKPSAEPTSSPGYEPTSEPGYEPTKEPEEKPTGEPTPDSTATPVPQVTESPAAKTPDITDKPAQGDSSNIIKPEKPKKTVVKKAVSKKKGTILIKWKKVKADGYQVMLAKNKKMTKGKKVYTIKGKKKISRTIKKLKRGRKYYVKVRAYNGLGNNTAYSAWSKKKVVKVH